MRPKMRAFCPILESAMLARPRTTASFAHANMFRYNPTRRSIFSMSRLPMKVEQQRQQGTPTTIQGVRFVKSKTRFRNAIVSSLVFYMAWVVYSRIVLEPLDRGAEEALKNLPDDGDEEDEKPLFIPFPGTTQQLKPVPYKGSDPEWQEFIKFSKDQKLAKRVRDDLANLVQQHASRIPLLKVRCGTDFKLRRYWLDVDFPAHPPPEFERTGLEIGDEYIAIAKQPIDSYTVFRLRQTLWPKALIQSFWSFVKVMVVDDTKYIAEKFGFGASKPTSSIEQIVAKHQQMFRGPQLPNKDGPPTSQPPAIGSGSQAITNPPSSDKAPVTGQKTDEDGTGTGTVGMAFTQHFLRPIMAFKVKLAQTWRPARDYPPRGSILLSGLVELDTSKAWLVFDVTAAWNPKTRDYDTRSMIIKLRRAQFKKQGPAIIRG